MLLFFGENFDFKSIEINGLHKVSLPKCRMGKLPELADVLFKNDGTRKIKRLTKLVENRRPAR